MAIPMTPTANAIANKVKMRRGAIRCSRILVVALRLTWVIPFDSQVTQNFPRFTKHNAGSELTPSEFRYYIVGPVLARALQPFPVTVRTLDAIHLSALEFIRAQKQSVELASYDERLVAAARLLGIAEWSESQ